MAEYIEREVLLDSIDHCINQNHAARYAMIDSDFKTLVEDIPVADVVSRDTLKQVMWERDLAIEQLKSIGLSLGEKSDVTKVVHEKWIMRGGWFRCSKCDGKALLKESGGTGGFHEYEQVRSNYCPNCGARMDLEG